MNQTNCSSNFAEFVALQLSPSRSDRIPCLSMRIPIKASTFRLVFGFSPQLSVNNFRVASGRIRLRRVFRLHIQGDRRTFGAVRRRRRGSLEHFPSRPSGGFSARTMNYNMSYSEYLPRRPLPERSARRRNMCAPLLICHSDAPRLESQLKVKVWL